MNSRFVSTKSSRRVGFFMAAAAPWKESAATLVALREKLVIRRRRAVMPTSFRVKKARMVRKKMPKELNSCRKK